jgi:3'(2'), 5'-bisphosphate nucleotidase
VIPTHDTGLAGPLGDELRAAATLAEAAGAVVAQMRLGTDASLGVEMKPGDEPVTKADRAASDLIVAGLAQAFPHDVVISEERADDLARLGAARVWYVDPIDGTKDFIRGSEGFAVMIGLCVDGAPAMGVVHQPRGGRTFWASPAGAWTAAPGSPPAPLRVSNVSDPAHIRLVASKSHRTETIDRVKQLLGISDELNIGSVGLKLCLIALGERDLYVNPWPKCKAWDTCAPEAILVRAGGRLTDTHGAPLRYDVSSLGREQGLIASNGRVHDSVVQRLAALFPNR